MSILIFVQPAEHKWDLHTLCLIQLLSRVELHLRRVARMLIAPASKLQPPTNQIGSTGPAHDQEQRVDNSNPEGILLFWLLQYLQEAPITQPNKSKENRNRLSRGGEEGGAGSELSEVERGCGLWPARSRDKMWTLRMSAVIQTTWGVFTLSKSLLITWGAEKAPPSFITRDILQSLRDITFPQRPDFFLKECLFFNFGQSLAFRDLHKQVFLSVYGRN